MIKYFKSFPMQQRDPLADLTLLLAACLSPIKLLAQRAYPPIPIVLFTSAPEASHTSPVHQIPYAAGLQLCNTGISASAAEKLSAAPPPLSPFPEVGKILCIYFLDVD